MIEDKRVNALLLRLVPPLVAWLMRVWFATCRVTLYDPENCFAAEEKDKRGIASFWHYSIVFILYHMRHYSATVMVSASRDGDYLAGLAKQLGYATVRGSRNNKGFEGLKSLLRIIRQGSSAALVADGSQGPARVVQPGALLLAARTGVPILPMVYAASSYFAINSWDKTIIPKPFSRVDFYYGEPFYVPEEVTADDLEQYRLQLEQRLNALYIRAWSRYGKAVH